jgi:hypothetical protein
MPQRGKNPPTEHCPRSQQFARPGPNFNMVRMSAWGRMSRASPVQTAMRNSTRDEGRSFGFGNQVLISNHRAKRRPRSTVLSHCAAQQMIRLKCRDGSQRFTFRVSARCPLLPQSRPHFGIARSLGTTFLFRCWRLTNCQCPKFDYVMSWSIGFRPPTEAAVLTPSRFQMSANHKRCKSSSGGMKKGLRVRTELVEAIHLVRDIACVRAKGRPRQ